MKKKKQFILQMYYGGTKSMNEEDTEKIRLMWKAWKYKLEKEEKMYDPGNPFADNRKIINGVNRIVSDGFKDNEFSPNGFIIILAEDIEKATEIAKDCPHLETGGSVEVREVIEVIWRD